MRRLILAGLAASALCACAGTNLAPDKLVANAVASCRRHAVDGPGGPSLMVGGAGFSSLMLNRSRLVTNEDMREAIYRDCLQQHGYVLEPGNFEVNPARIGVVQVAPRRA